jgi:hypothetical protein
MHTVIRQSRLQIQTVSMLLAVNARTPSLAFSMSARRVAGTSSEETDMAQWTQFTKQHDSYDKRDERKHRRHRRDKRRH